MAKRDAFDTLITIVMRSSIVALFLCAPAIAFANCVNPPGGEGNIFFNADVNVPQVCTGTNWVALGVLNPSAGGSGCSNPAGVEGQIVYNGDVHKPQYCDGDDWREMIGTVPGDACDSTPGAFDFTDQTGVPPGQTIQSDIVQISGIR